MAYKRWNDAGSVVVVVANLKDEFGGGGHDPQLAGRRQVARIHQHNYDVEASGGALTDSLAVERSQNLH